MAESETLREHGVHYSVEPDTLPPIALTSTRPSAGLRVSYPLESRPEYAEKVAAIQQMLERVAEIVADAPTPSVDANYHAADYYGEDEAG